MKREKIKMRIDEIETEKLNYIRNIYQAKSNKQFSEDQCQQQIGMQL